MSSVDEYLEPHSIQEETSSLIKKIGLPISKSTEEGKFKRELEARRLRWQRKIQIPKDAQFCPLVYANCRDLRKLDTNCFITKAPGCPEYSKYLEESMGNDSADQTFQDSETYATQSRYNQFQI